MTREELRKMWHETLREVKKGERIGLAKRLFKEWLHNKKLTEEIREHIPFSEEKSEASIKETKELF